MLKALAHTAYHVTDMTESLRFYCEGLGLTEAFELRDDKGTPWIRYLRVAPGQFIELFYAKPQPAENISYAHLCLEVTDIQEAVRQLREGGFPVDAEPKQGSDCNWQAWTHDPDGNRIELMQYHPDCPQLAAH